MWRRFLPKRTPRMAAIASTDIFTAAQIKLDELLAGHSLKVESLEELTHNLKENLSPDDMVDLLTLLMLQAPRAARAQMQMDEHPHGYRDREKRLYELIDFNDTFVSTVLLLQPHQLSDFVVQLEAALAAICRRVGSMKFSERQYEAIVHGLSREIAVYRSALETGFEARMTTRSDDAFGIDMQLRWPETGQYINVDIKTASAFHFRLTDLLHQGRIAPHDQLEAESKGFWQIVNRHDDQHVTIILLRIEHEELGNITNFAFDDFTLLRERLIHIIERFGLSDGRFGQPLVR